jgi:hypothetical protein
MMQQKTNINYSHTQDTTGGLTLFEPTCPFIREEHEEFVFMFYFNLRHNLDILAYKHGAYLLS